MAGVLQVGQQIKKRDGENQAVPAKDILVVTVSTHREIETAANGISMDSIVLAIVIFILFLTDLSNLPIRRPSNTKSA